MFFRANANAISEIDELKANTTREFYMGEEEFTRENSQKVQILMVKNHATCTETYF